MDVAVNDFIMLSICVDPLNESKDSMLVYSYKQLRKDREEATMEENKAVVEQVEVQYEYASSTGEYEDGKDLED
ncbi:hypothetical protein WN944_019029 [Citrus x changshan-huyou]|uniref:Uncharacterized protein n=1 Tax=Citrus x changshan-huyou TaxID=2935761 RepID=A0AAP0LVV0_9ROSI